MGITPAILMAKIVPRKKNNIITCREPKMDELLKGKNKKCNCGKLVVDASKNDGKIITKSFWGETCWIY